MDALLTIWSCILPWPWTRVEGARPWRLYRILLRRSHGVRCTVAILQVWKETNITIENNLCSPMQKRKNPPPNPDLNKARKNMARHILAFLSL